MNSPALPHNRHPRTNTHQHTHTHTHRQVVHSCMYYISKSLCAYVCFVFWRYRVTYPAICSWCLCVCRQTDEARSQCDLVSFYIHVLSLHLICIWYIYIYIYIYSCLQYASHVQVFVYYAAVSCAGEELCNAHTAINAIKSHLQQSLLYNTKASGPILQTGNMLIYNELRTLTVYF